MVKRNFGAKGTAIGAIESRLPAGLGGFAPCNPPAPTLRLIKSVDEATGIVTSEVAVALSKAMMDKYGEGNWAVEFAFCTDKGDLNGYKIPYVRNGDYGEYGAMQDVFPIENEFVEAGFAPIPNDRLVFAVRYGFEPIDQKMSEYANMVSENGKLYSDWTLNTNGMTDASGNIFAGRPLVTYDGTGYFAHVVAPVGTVVVDGEDSHKSEVWLPADGKRHEVRTTVGFWGKNIYLTKDNIIRCDRDTFVSDSDIAVVDFTSFSGDKGVAVYAAKQAEAQMRQLIADAVAAGKAVIDVNPASIIEDFDQYEDVTFIDPGNGSSVEGGINYDSELNGGCYRIRVIGKAPEEEIEEGVLIRNYNTSNIVGMTVGDCGNFSAAYATVETMTVGDCGNFIADYATVETMTVGDVSGNFSAASATVETMTLNVTATVTNGVVSSAQLGAIYVPASLVNDFKTTSIFAADYADIIYPISA